MREYTIYSKWLANALRNQGFRLLRSEPNPKRPQYDCWVFQDNTDLQIAISYMTRNRNK